MNQQTKKILIAATIIIVPFSSVFVGGYFLYKALSKKKEKPLTINEKVEQWKEELKNDGKQ